MNRMNSYNQIQNKYYTTSAYSYIVGEILLKMFSIRRVIMRSHFQTIFLSIQNYPLSYFLQWQSSYQDNIFCLMECSITLYILLFGMWNILSLLTLGSTYSAIMIFRWYHHTYPEYCIKKNKERKLGCWK